MQSSHPRKVKTIEIKRLRKRSILKFELYSYLDLIEEDTNIADEDPFFSPAFKYLLASLQLCDFPNASADGASLLNTDGLLGAIRTLIQQVLEQLDKLMFKKTNTVMTFTIMFILCVIKVGTEIRLQYLMRRAESPTIIQDHCPSVQSKWHDTMVALISACKDIAVYGDIKESLFELTNWKLEYVELLADQAAHYQEFPLSPSIAVEGRLLWKLTTLHTKLFTACAEGNEELVRSLLNKAPRFGVESGAGWSGLHWASNNGCWSVVKLLIAKGRSISIEDQNGWPPLYVATRIPQDTLVSTLLEGGADTNVETRNGSTALHQAVAEGHVSTVRLLLDKHTDIDKPDKREEAPLYLAAAGDHPEIAQLLAERGADLSTFNVYGETPMHLAASSGGVKVLEVLVNHDAKIDSTDSYEATPLHRAAENGHEAAVCFLLKLGSDIEAQNRYGETPLFLAARNGHGGMVQLLLDKGSNAKSKSKIEATALHEAAENGHTVVIGLLLDQGVDVVAIVVYSKKYSGGVLPRCDS